jgi:threonine dehydrogenase-like Zn-dependent dehydrogenase
MLSLVKFGTSLTLTGSRATTSSSWTKALALLGSGKVNAAPLITHRLPIDACETGFQLVRSKEAIKVVFQF